MRILTFLWLFPFMLAARDQEDSLILRIDSFTRICAQKQALFNTKDPNKKYSYTYARCSMLIYDGNKDTAQLIRQDLHENMPLQSIIQKYKLDEAEAYFKYVFLLKPVFLDKYYHKILFHTIPNLNRHHNLLVDNPGLKQVSDLKAGTRLYDTSEWDVCCVQFEEPFKKHAFPAFMNEAFNYYAAVTGGPGALYKKLDYIKPPPVLDALSDVWDKFEEAPDEPRRDAYEDSVYKKKAIEYKRKLEEYERKKCDYLNAAYSGPALKERLTSFSDYLHKNNLTSHYQFDKIFSCLNIPAHATNELYVIGYRRHAQRRNLGVMIKSLEENNYSRFTRSVLLYHIYSPGDKLEKALVKAQNTMFTYPEKIHLGTLAATLADSKSACSFIISSLENADEDSVKKNLVITFKNWLKTKPADLLLVYVAAHYWRNYIDDNHLLDEAEDMEKEWRETLKAYPRLADFIEEN